MGDLVNPSADTAAGVITLPNRTQDGYNLRHYAHVHTYTYKYMLTGGRVGEGPHRHWNRSGTVRVAAGPDEGHRDCLTRFSFFSLVNQLFKSVQYTVPKAVQISKLSLGAYMGASPLAGKFPKAF